MMKDTNMGKFKADLGHNAPLYIACIFMNHEKYLFASLKAEQFHVPNKTLNILTCVMFWSAQVTLHIFPYIWI